MTAKKMADSGRSTLEFWEEIGARYIQIQDDFEID